MKHTYHTDTIIQYQLGLLPDEAIGRIPSSTLHNWKSRDLSQLMGVEYLYGNAETMELLKTIASVKHLLKAAKALFLIYRAYVTMLQSLKTYHKVLHDSQKLIVDTINQTNVILGKKRALRAFGISYQQYHAWKRKIGCTLQPMADCRKNNRRQVSFPEIETIKAYLTKEEYLHWGLAPVYYQMLRDKAAYVSRTTFYKYARLLSFTRPKPTKRRYGPGIRADAPRKILHMDVTIYRPLDRSKLYIYFLVDNYSRYILNYKISGHYSAKIAFENIREAYQKHDLEKIPPYIDLITDDGPENKGEVERFTDDPATNLRKLIAQTDIVFSNSLVEAVNKRMKYDFLFTQNLQDQQETEKYLAVAVPQYGNKPHSSLFGLTPYEVFNGMIPDKNRFKPEIKRAAIERRTINLEYNCLGCFNS